MSCFHKPKQNGALASAKTILGCPGRGSRVRWCIISPRGHAEPQHLAGPRIDHVQPTARCTGHPLIDFAVVLVLGCIVCEPGLHLRTGARAEKAKRRHARTMIRFGTVAFDIAQ
jgi:hypothetical protein